MKKTAISLLLIIGIFALSTGVGAAMLSPGLDILSAETEMTVSAARGETVVFSAEQFASGAGARSCSSIEIASLPAPECGTLMFGDVECVKGQVITASNHCGGILGGITNGMPLILRAAFKPTPSIGMEQDTVDLRTMENTTLTIHGRHDPCIVHRAVPCVEAAVAVAVYDAFLQRKKEI